LPYSYSLYSQDFHSMFDKLRAYFERSFSLSDVEFDIMKREFTPRNLKKGEFIHREGEVTKYGAWVAQGIVRSYIIDQKGKEHIVQFAAENWWISDFNSLNKGEPSLYFIDALEDSEILLIDFPSMKKLLAAIPAFAAHFQKGITTHTASKERRIIASISTSAEDRYKDFLKSYPGIAQRVPQHMLASYLGVSPETLSRVRKQMSQKK